MAAIEISRTRKIRGKTYRLFDNHFDKKFAVEQSKALSKKYDDYDVQVALIPGSEKAVFRYGVWVRIKSRED